MNRPHRWLVLTVESPSDALTDALAEGLILLGGTAVEQVGLTLHTFLPPPAIADSPGPVPAAADEAAERVARDAAQVLGENAGCAPPPVRWRWQDEEDWLARWRAGLRPRRVGEKLIVAPTWTLSEVDAEPGVIVIAIDPKMAFGTGEHASTRGVLRLLEPRVPPGAHVLDVGAGSAILAIAAVKLGASAVLAVENDEMAIDNARENLVRNEVDRVVELECNHVDAAYLRAHGPYDVIVANVLRSVLEPLLPAFRAALRRNGVLIAGGIVDTESAQMLEAAAFAEFTTDAEDREDGWWSAALRAR